MVLNKKGYIYTILVVIISLILVSLFLFYTQSSVVVSKDSINRMQGEEMHYFLESVKSDSSRALTVSLQRAAVYATDYVFRSNETLENYTMTPCGGIKYMLNGSEAAIAELMVCGTFKGVKSNYSRYLENNTIPDWINRTSDQAKLMNFKIQIKLEDLTIGLYDPFNMAYLAYFDIVVYDRVNQTQYHGYHIPVTGIVPTYIMEDPLYYVKFGMPPLVRGYRECETHQYVDAETLDSFIDRRCYLTSDSSYGGPSVFDRLDGRSTLHGKYKNQTAELASKLNFSAGAIGVESFINMDELASYNITINANNSQVDYLYWNNTFAYCGVEGMFHADFKIDTPHARKYNVQGLYCAIVLKSPSPNQDAYYPTSISVPVNTTIYWFNQDTAAHSIAIWPPVWSGTRSLPPASHISWTFNQTGTYTYACLVPGHMGSGSIIVG